MKNKKKKQRISTIAFAILIKLHHERSFDEVVDVFFFEFEKEFRGKNCHAFSSPLEDEKRREEKKKSLFRSRKKSGSSGNVCFYSQ